MHHGEGLGRLALAQVAGHLLGAMPSEPAYYPLLRVLIVLVGAVLFLTGITLVGVLTDAPIRGVVHGIREHFGGGGLAIFIAGSLGVLLWSNLAERRKDERRRIAETGLLEHRHRPFSRDGWARNVAILLTPLALVALAGLAMWLTGTPLPPGPAR